MVKNITYGVLFTFCFFFLGLNVIYSQLVSPLYFNQVVNEKKTVIDYLKSIRTLPEFGEQLMLYKNLYGEQVEEEVFYDDSIRKQKIKNLELLLEKNLKARDILYSIFLLYSNEGDEKKALEYLDRARSIDPAL